MTQTTTSSSLICAIGLTFGISAGALAGPPQILNQIPADAPFVVAVPSLDELAGDLQGMLRAAEFPMANMVDADQMLMMQGMGGMIDTNRPAAIFIPSLPEGDNEPIFVGLAPCPDVQKVVDMAEGEDLGGVFAIDADGQDMYLRPVGNGYAAFGDDMDAVKNFQPGAGNLDAHLKNAGAAGRSLIEGASVVIMTNVGVMGPWMEQLKDTVGDNMAGMGMGGDAVGDMMMEDNALSAWLEQNLVRDGDYLVAGLIPSANGLSIEATMSFKDGSDMANAFGARANASRIMGSVPNQPFIMAYAFDTKAAPVRNVVQGFMDAAKEMQAGAGNAGMFPSFPMDDVSGQAMLMGMSPGIMFGGGLFANTVFYTETSNPSAMVGSMREMLDTMDGTSEGGVDIETSYETAKTTIGGVETDAWAIKMVPDGSNPMAMQTSGMVFGPSMGPDGYLAATDSGIVQTFAKNSILMQAAIDASKGQGDTLAKSDPMLAAVGEQLPSGRIFEFYLGVGPIAETAGPMLAGFMGINLDLPASIPPVAMGVGSKDGAAHMSVFIPTPVIRVAGSLATAAMMEGGF